MSQRVRALPFLLLLAACAHCDSGSSETAPNDAGPVDASGGDGGTLDAAGDAMSTDATSAADGNTPNDAMTSADANAPDAARPLPQHTYVYVSGYGTEPLRVFEINRSTLALTPVIATNDAGKSPTYLAPSSNGKRIYAANEDNGKPGITVLGVDPTTGLVRQDDVADDITGNGFVFTAVDPSGKFVLATSYNGANVGVYGLDSNGLITQRVDQRQFAAGAQSHSVRVHPSGKWAYVPNKGLDSVAQLGFDSAGKLTDKGSFTRNGFDGPRHIAFSPNGKLAFVVLELGNEVVSFTIDEATGALVEADHKPRLPASYQGSDSGAHVLSHPNGSYLYASNRGSNTIAVYSYDAQGKLTLVEHESTRGNTPRNFDIDPSGEFLVVANQNSGNAAVFAIGADGKLTPRGDVVGGLGQPAAVAIIGF